MDRRRSCVGGRRDRRGVRPSVRTRIRDRRLAPPSAVASAGGSSTVARVTEMVEQLTTDIRMPSAPEMGSIRGHEGGYEPASRLFLQPQ